MREDVELDVTNLAIFERYENDEKIPQGFTAATYKIDVRPNSSLYWNVASESLPLVFDLDLGLFSSSWKGFSHQGYFQTCQFALNHVLPLLEHALGCIIARLKLPFSQYVPWTEAIEENFEAWKKMRTLHDKKLFCRDLIVEYLTLLTSSIPSNKLRYLLLDAEEINDPLSFFQLTQKDAFGSFSLAIQQAPYPTSGCPIGRTLELPPIQNPNIAFLLPSYTKATKELQATMQAYVDKNIPFKVIVEDFLTSEWDGIDELVITATPYSETTKRALDGFQASGGLLVST